MQFQPANKFVYHPNPRWFQSHKYDMQLIKSQHYYGQYIKWQKETNDPALLRSSWWADNFEELGRWL